MKRVTGSLLALLLLTGTLAAVAGQPVRAQVEGPVEGQLKPGSHGAMFENITMDCLAVKFKLSKVHENDGLNRVNLGQLYDAMSTKLMGQLNSRIVSNHLDGSSLVKTAADFQMTLNKFKNDYQTYEEQMSALIKSDCSSQPMIFYRNLENVQRLRTYVNNDVVQLNRLMTTYQDEVQTFYDIQIATPHQEGES